MSPLPTPARRLLVELAALYLMDAGPTHTASPVQWAFSALMTLLDVQAVALAEIDRIETDLVVRHGYPHVALPTQSGALPLYATDATTIQRHLGTGPAGRRSITNLRRWQRRFVEAAEAAGLPAAQTPERRRRSTLHASPHACPPDICSARASARTFGTLQDVAS